MSARTRITRIASALIAVPISCAIAFGAPGVAHAATSTSQGGVGADKATQVTMSITNDTDETLNLTSATSSGSGNHWQQRPTTSAPGGYEVVSHYAAGDTEISLTYTSADTGTVYTLHAETPLVGHNSTSGSSSNSSYTVNSTTDTGYDPTDIFNMDPGHTFTYTGQPQTYTVPAGVHQLDLKGVGGSGGSGMVGSNEPSGAEVSGSLQWTPARCGPSGSGAWADRPPSSSRVTTAGPTPTTETPRAAGVCRTAVPATPTGPAPKTNGSGSADGGLGGGGVQGGLAGSTIGEGGGAGSSYFSSQLLQGTVRVAPNGNTNAGADSEVVISGTTGIDLAATPIR